MVRVRTSSVVRTGRIQAGWTDDFLARLEPARTQLSVGLWHAQTGLESAALPMGFLCLPAELQLHVARFLEASPEHQAALCLAIPPLGRRAIKALPSYQDPLLSVALRLDGREPAGLIDLRLLRRYAQDSRATEAGCAWLARISSDPAIHVESADGFSDSRVWWLQSGRDDPCRIRMAVADGSVVHMDGEPGNERMVRTEHPGGRMDYFADGPGPKTRVVRVEWPDGAIIHCEGKPGTPQWGRLISQVDPDGTVTHYTGEVGNERVIRQELSDGSDGLERWYEGEQGSERIVREEYPNGTTLFFEGDQGCERWIRVEYPDGKVQYYEGEQGSERRVRLEWPDGGLPHCILNPNPGIRSKGWWQA